MDLALVGELLAIGTLPPLLVFAAANDIARLKIPNWISAALVLLFFPVALVAGFDAHTLGIHAGAGAGALVIGFLLFVLNWVGAGDAKLFAAIALWMGFPGAIEFALLSSIIGGGLALALLAARKAAEYAPPWPWLADVERRTKRIPYAVALSGGALIAYPGSDLFLALTR
jgi:prepilin peptidase CpaA